MNIKQEIEITNSKIWHLSSIYDKLNPIDCKKEKPKQYKQLKRKLERNKQMIKSYKIGITKRGGKYPDKF